MERKRNMLEERDEKERGERMSEREREREQKRETCKSVTVVILCGPFFELMTSVRFFLFFFFCGPDFSN